MSELVVLDGYEGQTVDKLLALEGTHRIDSIVQAFEQALEQKVVRIGPTSLNNEERVVLAVGALEREVNEGGFEQFFVGTSREFAPAIVPALRRIECPRTAGIAQRAVNALHVTVPTDEAVQSAMEEDDPERDEIFADCDRKYYDCDEDIAVQLFAFVKAHKDRIRF